MVTLTEEKAKETQARAAEPTGYGAYGASANREKDLSRALDPMPEAKAKGSMDFIDSDKRWLKELGITTSDPHSHHREWESDREKSHQEHRKWNESVKGRLALRSVSRGVVGAVFYSVANQYAGKALKGYTYENTDPQGLLQHVARFIDNTVGEGIFKTAKVFTHGDGVRARKAVMFRDTRDFGYRNKGAVVMGRSLGAEAVAITFDFASMSFGDYMTRYFIGLADPNAKTHWMKDGHLDVPGGLKDLLKNVFRGVTYAAGEDMAVAIPYVYGMRLQRKIIDHYSPGFRYDSDLALNGASLKMKGGTKLPDGSVKGSKIAGDYELEGMLDLMSRFAWYNVGTKMFRDAYSVTASKVENWWNGDRKVHAPHIDPDKITPKNAALAAAHAVRYVARTTIKVMGYMLAATPFFFLTRTPQTKNRGVAIHPEYGVLTREAVTSHSPVKAKAMKHGSAVSEDLYNKPADKWDLFYLDDKMVRHPTTDNPFPTHHNQPYAEANTNEAFTRAGVEPPAHRIYSNFVGDIHSKLGAKLHGGLEALDEQLQKKLGIKIMANTDDRKRSKKIEGFARRYVNAAISYTPYFMMKTDVLSAEWDTARTDMGLDRSLDGIGTSIMGVVTMNGQKVKAGLGEFKAGLGEARRSLMREPFTDPRREEQAQREIWYSDPEHASNEAYQLNGIAHRAHRGPGAVDEGKVFAHENLKPKPITPTTFTQLKTPESWAAQEAMRKFQEVGAFDGQSVH